MSKENRISIRLSSRHYTFLSSHPLFASHSLTEAIEICIEKTRQSLLAKQTLISSPLSLLSDDEKAIKNLFTLFTLLDFADRKPIASFTETHLLDAFYSSFGFRFELPSEFDNDYQQHLPSQKQ